ncbi:Cyclin-D5-1 [Striga hermonthica]|uniref:Cyclin-D5-1 n=1 Tax=Striga hermonthica TaxID=68872 RepID=A0A9N7RH37_STRHE|nr:Cyclin-D5-1 [Striga hermonthica]
MESGVPLLNLLCDEDISSLNSNLFDKNDNPFDSITITEPDCEFIESSFRKETSFRATRVERWPESARLEAVKWILQTRALFGYHYRTAYLALIYFDQFLAKTCFSDGKTTWTNRILSVACLSLAAKMEESKARPLIEYRVEGYDFQGIAIQKMELCVLHELEWKMGVLTPFAYLNYFTAKFCTEKSRLHEIATRAAELVMAIVEEINAAENRPSIIAAASVLTAYDHNLESAVLEDKINSIPSWGSPEKDLAFSCYRLLQEIVMLKTPKSAVIPSSLLANNDSTITSKCGSKRRLNFGDSDEH